MRSKIFIYCFAMNNYFLRIEVWKLVRKRKRKRFIQPHFSFLIRISPSSLGNLYCRMQLPSPPSGTSLASCYTGELHKNHYLSNCDLVFLKESSMRALPLWKTAGRLKRSNRNYATPRGILGRLEIEYRDCCLQHLPLVVACCPK
jgi:hypothetical protein